MLVSFRICLLYYKNIYFTSFISYMFYDFMKMVGFGSGSVQFDRIRIRPKGSEQIWIRNTAYSPIKLILSSVSREESGPSCSKKRAAVGCQEEPAKRACYRVSKKGLEGQCHFLPFFHESTPNRLLIIRLK